MIQIFMIWPNAQWRRLGWWQRDQGLLNRVSSSLSRVSLYQKIT